jgi:hypothetical protein
MSAALTPLRRGFGSGIRYAVSLPGSREWVRVSEDEKTIMLEVELLRAEGSVKPASAALEARTVLPVVPVVCGVTGVCSWSRECERG